ncbi:hypothetical protein LR69_00133 [Geobacillus sp. BCO2]|nr:hypothetical protein LR69_00133 [Geobacillus sp. BCO2]
MDEVDFALALRRYDVLAMQPHFPGYPYFILGGMAVHALVANPAKALSILNVLVLCSAAFPIVWLLARHMPRSAALWAALSVLSSSYVLLAAARPMSDGAALGVLWWYIWAVEWARRRTTWPAQLWPAVLFSLLMGIRLSYAPFAAALLILWHEDWKTHRRLGRVAASLLAAAAFQFVWVAAVAATEGGLWPFFKLGWAFVVGHFSDWGERRRVRFHFGSGCAALSLTTFFGPAWPAETLGCWPPMQWSAPSPGARGGFSGRARLSFLRCCMPSGRYWRKTLKSRATFFRWFILRCFMCGAAFWLRGRHGD